MKSIIRSTLFHAFALSLLPVFFSGVRIDGGIPTFLLGGFLLSLLTFFIKPILGIIAIPFNFMTFGFFSFLVNAIILYLLTIFLPQITIQAFTYSGFSAFGFVIPAVAFNIIFAYIISALVLSLTVSGLKWMTNT